MGKDDNKKEGVSIWHLIYGVIILALLAIFLLLIAPGHINEEAFSHFSFASTLISIVLAVVSIVYSLQSGLSNNTYRARIDEIQRNISDRMSELHKIEISLKNLVDEHRENLKGNTGNSTKNETTQNASEER
ncbi:MAG: hypothetical protein J6U22_05420 [Bacteroidaceae bacterium]|nr:hypothetical protein [Bacteroidaceae bacterium]